MTSQPGPWFYATFDQLPSQPMEDSMANSETVRCTCDGTPPKLPERRTISSHHETCPVNRETRQKLNRE
jgi:hypothetical protein